MSLVEAPPVDELDMAFAKVMDALQGRGVDDALFRCQGYQRRLDALETQLLAAKKQAGARDADTERAAGRGASRSRTEARRRTDRAAAVVENPRLGDDLANDEISPEQLDAIATAAKGSDGKAAHDQDLIDQIKAADPDQARTIAKTWLDDHNADDAEEAHLRQRSLRKITTFTTMGGTKAIMAEGDRTTIDEIWGLIEDRSKHLYERDGGRGLEATKHPRTRDQRRFDAFHQLVAGNARGSDEAPKRPGIIAIGHLDDDGHADFVGGGPVPASVLTRLRCNADIYGVLFDKAGQPLWTGRRHRGINHSQWIALVARDNGCVLCGADPIYCEAHHIIPWHSPARGRTDITNLALLCTNCHHHTHDTHQTLELDPRTSTWHLRPATPAETPPPRTKDPP